MERRDGACPDALPCLMITTDRFGTVKDGQPMFMDKAGGPLGLRNAKEKQLDSKVFSKSHGGSADGSEDEGINPVNGRPKRVINPKKKLSFAWTHASVKALPVVGAFIVHADGKLQTRSPKNSFHKLEPPCGDFLAGLS